MLNIKYIFLCYLFLISNSLATAQIFRQEVSYKMNDTLMYQRSIVTSSGDTVVDTIQTIVTNIHFIVNNMVIIKFNNLFPLCRGNNKIEIKTDCINKFSNELLIFNIKSKKIYRNQFFRSENDIDLNSEFNKILNKKYILIDSIYSFETEESDNIFNGKKYNYNKAYFFPFVNYNDNKLIDENREEELNNTDINYFIWERFPRLISQKKYIKTFKRIGDKDGEKEYISINNKMLLLTYIFYPPVKIERIEYYKFKLLEIKNNSVDSNR